MAFYSDKCMIMDDEEMETAAKRIEWRGKNSFETRSLFAPVKTAAEFPKAFQEFPSLPNRAVPIASGGNSLGSARSYRQALVEMKVPEKPKEFRPLLDLFNTLELTPEFIAEFGVPLLPMPEFLDSRYVDDDGDYRYAACTPPAELEVCEAS